MLKQRNTKKQGDVGLGQAIAYYTSLGYTVMLPLTDSQDYDLVVDIDDKLYRVQVKTTTNQSEYGAYQVQLEIRGGNRSFNTGKKFDKTKVDLVFVVSPEHKYNIPSSVITSLTRINVGRDSYKEYQI